ncbi:MAG: LuxR C-terminal-related transcriptional regulator, partial [Armatimonadetes bacterium]|nr:LuxR C-terminal-related transcriptional regulator [Armatimonadota bacterium]
MQRLQDKKDRLETTLRHARDKLDQRAAREMLLQRAAEYLRSFPAVWEQLNPDERRELFQTLVEYVVMTRADNGDTILRVKVLFTDEKELRIPHLGRKTQTGLSLRQLAILELHHQGLNTDQIARQMCVTAQCINALSYVIKHNLGVASLDEAYERCREDIERFR